MGNRITNSVLNHLGPQADIWFDGEKLQFVGCLPTQFGEEQFEAKSVKRLIKGYEQAVNRQAKQNDIFLCLVEEVSNARETIESGESIIYLDLSETEQNIGAKIKLMLSIADGAAFSVQEGVVRLTSI